MIRSHAKAVSLPDWMGKMKEAQALADRDRIDYVIYDDGTYEPMRDAALSRVNWILRPCQIAPVSH